MDTLTATDFAAAVQAAISGVRHLYREITRLHVALTEELEREPLPMRKLLPTGKDAREGRVVVRDWFGQLYVGGDLDELLDDEEDDDGDEGDEGEEIDDGNRAKRQLIPLEPAQPVLGVKVVVHDSRGSSAFVPRIIWAILGDWGIGPTKQRLDGAVEVKRYMLKRLLKVIDEGADRGRVVTGAKIAGKTGRKAERNLSTQILGPIGTKALFDLAGTDSVHSLAMEIKDHWKRYGVVGGRSPNLGSQA
jgi:hypothetical protein